MADFSKLLPKAPARRLTGTLVRAVATRALFPSAEPVSPDFLFTSGKQNRFNLSGTDCLYWAEDEATALAEYRRQFQGIAHGTKQPVTLFYAEVRLDRVVDLTDEGTRRTLGVTLRELESNWGGGRPPTTAQRIGQAVAGQSKLCAIRYGSVAAAKAGVKGRNVVIFKSGVHHPSFVRILGPTKKLLQKWP